MQTTPLTQIAQRILPLIDLTSLGENDDEGKIQQLCSHAVTHWGNVAAICVYPQFVAQARSLITTSGGIAIATVVNFPQGNQTMKKVLSETTRSIDAGADEIDLVFPYQAFLKGEHSYCSELVTSVRQVCGSQIKLKLILETGMLKSLEAIAKATEMAIAAQVDFIKTSTGKVAVNATLSAAETILSVIAASDRANTGFKASGGIATVDEAGKYLALADHLLGPDWVTKERFRFGASSLLSDVTKHLINAVE